MTVRSLTFPEWNDTSKVYAIPIQTAEPYKLIYAAGRS